MEITKFKNHRMSGLKGVLAVIFGLIALFFPGGTLLVLAKIFGIFALIAGIVIIILTYTNSKIEWNPRFWLIEGIVDIVLGILLLAFPETMVEIFFVLLGVLALVMGIIQLVTADRFKEIMNHNIILFNGILAVLFGILILTRPFEGAQVLITILGLFALIYGGISLYTSYKLYQNKDTE